MKTKVLAISVIISAISINLISQDVTGHNSYSEGIMYSVNKNENIKSFQTISFFNMPSSESRDQIAVPRPKNNLRNYSFATGGRKAKSKGVLNPTKTYTCRGRRGNSHTQK